MIYSFSHKGSPCDNACIGSFHAILKKEEVKYRDIDSAKTLKAGITEKEYMEASDTRLHKS